MYRAQRSNRSINYAGGNDEAVYFIIDSGCTAHLTNRADLFVTYKEYPTCRTLSTAVKGGKLIVKGAGDIKMYTRDRRGRNILITLSNVLTIIE